MLRLFTFVLCFIFALLVGLFLLWFGRIPESFILELAVPNVLGNKKGSSSEDCVISCFPSFTYAVWISAFVLFSNPLTNSIYPSAIFNILHDLIWCGSISSVD